jgi:hypothetical protein
MVNSHLVECSWDKCPSHTTFDPSDAIVLTWPRALQKVRYFHSTECLSGYARTFPDNFVTSGELNG